MMRRLLGFPTTALVFGQLSKTKCGYKSRSTGLNYSHLRELVLEAFKDIVPDLCTIDTHSLFKEWRGVLLPTMLVFQIAFFKSSIAVGEFNQLG